MTTPAPGSDPNHPQEGAPQGQPRWDAPQPQGYQPQDYPQPQGYQPAPSYSGGPDGYGAPTGARPQQVLIAAVLGFVVALFALLAALGLFALSTLLGILALFGVIYLALAAANIWGGIVAMMGKGSSILKGAGIATAVLALIGLVLALTQGSFSFLSLLLVAAGVAIFFLLNQPVSQQFFAAHGKK